MIAVFAGGGGMSEFLSYVLAVMWHIVFVDSPQCPETPVAPKPL